MGRKRKPDKLPRRTVAELPLPEQQKAHNTLSLALMRAKAVQLLSHSLIPSVPDFDQAAFLRAIVLVNPTDGIRGLQAAWLYFACAETVMELWEARIFGDAAITARIKDDPRRVILTGMRDVVFHALALDEPRMAAFYDQWEEVEQWSTPILDDMAHYTRTWYLNYLAEVQRQKQQ
jgi:hypothetical protein